MSRRRCAVAATQPRHRRRRDPSRAAVVRARRRGQRPLRRDDRPHRCGDRQGDARAGAARGRRRARHRRPSCGPSSAGSPGSSSSTSSGVVIRRIAAGYTMYNVAAGFRREVTRQYLRLPLAWHHRHPSGQLLSNANADVEATWNVFAPLPMAIGVIIMLRRRHRADGARRPGHGDHRPDRLPGRCSWPTWCSSAPCRRKVVAGPAAARRGAARSPTRASRPRSSSRRWAARSRRPARFEEVTRRLQRGQRRGRPHPRHLRPASSSRSPRWAPSPSSPSAPSRSRTAPSSPPPSSRSPT